MRKRIDVKVRILCSLPGVFDEYQPEVGKTYDAVYMPAYGSKNRRNAELAIIDILDKRICLRPGEYELVGG